MGTARDYGPIQAPRELGLAVWMFEAALRRALIPPADHGGRWSAEVIADAAARCDQIRAQLPDGPPIGATRAAVRIAERLVPVEVAAAEVEALAVRGLLTAVDNYKGHPLYDRSDLDRVAAEHSELIASLAAERHGWDQASITRDQACAELGWSPAEFVRVTADRGLVPGRFGRWGRATIASLAVDEQLGDRVRRARLVGPDQAATHLQVRRVELDYLIAAGLLTATTHVDSELSRYRYVTVALYSVGALEDLLDFDGIDWDRLRGLRPGEPSPLRELTALPIERATLVRGLAADLTETHGVEFRPRYHYRDDEWRLSWQPDATDTPDRATVAAEIASRPLLRPHADQITLHPMDTAHHGR